jgi:hypothetical protein
LRFLYRGLLGGGDHSVAIDIDRRGGTPTGQQE